jgi:hypothetical protein
MKRLLTLALMGAALLALPSLASAHEYDRDDSDYPLRVVAYAVHPIGIAVEYALLRPIHWLVSQPDACIWFGHEPTENETHDYFAWQQNWE